MERNHFLIQLFFLLVVAGVFGVLPLFVDNGTMRFLTDFFLLIGIAQLWNLLAGFGGIVSIGQHLFLGAGAYAFFAMTSILGIHPYVSLPLAIPFGAALAVPVYAILSRLKLAYFAIGSWVLAEVMLLLAGKIPGFGGGSGVSLSPSIVKTFGTSIGDRMSNIYWLALGITVFIILLIIILLQSRHGLALKAMRDNETAAMAVGVNTVFVKVLLFLISGAFLSLLGAVGTLLRLRISPAASFNITDGTIFIIFIVVVGGIGRVIGPVLGAIIFLVLRETLSAYGPIYMIILGGLAIATMLIEPKGAAGLFGRISKKIRNAG